jgi:hypothetical protein
MSESVIGCPACGTRLKLSSAARGKQSVRCPRCGGGVPVGPPRAADDPADQLDEVQPDDELDDLEEVTNERPSRRRPRADRYEDDDRPRRRDRRRREEKPGPWLLALAAAPLGFVAGLVIGVASLGTHGLPAAKPGEVIAKGLGIVLMFVVAGILILVGTLAVRERKAVVGRWRTTTVRGLPAILIGFIYTGLGGLLGGFGVYAVFFEVVHLLRG